MDALTKATLLSTEAPFARSFLASDALPAQRSTASARTATVEGTRTAAAVVLLVTGVLLLAEAIVTIAWQEPFSAWSASRQQDRLSAELREAESAALAAPAAFTAKRDRVSSAPALFAERHRRRTENGDPLGRLRIPSIGAKFVFVEGANPGQLEKGPGHYAGTALPGERGTVGVAGHRTTFLAPFRNIDSLRKGDSIVLQMPYGRFRYEVEGSIVVSPSNTASLRRVKHDRLVLTTCTPLFSAAQRLVVTASPEDRNYGDAPAGSERGPHHGSDAHLPPGRVEYLVPVPRACHPGGDDPRRRRARRQAVEDVLAGGEPAAVTGAPDPVDDRAATERDVPEVVLADHVPGMLRGRAVEDTAGAQRPQAMRSALAVLEAEDGVGEAPHAGRGPVCVAVAGRRARVVIRLRLWRKAHAERKRNQCGDSEAAQNAA